MSERRKILKADKKWLQGYLSKEFDDSPWRTAVFNQYKDNYLAIEDFKKGLFDTEKMVQEELIKKIFPDFYKTRPEGMPYTLAEYIRWIGYVGGGGCVSPWLEGFNQRIDRLSEYSATSDEVTFELALEILADLNRNPYKNYLRLNKYTEAVDALYKGPRS